MKDGFIYPLVNWLVLKLNWINLVQLFKWLVNLFNKKKTKESTDQFNRIGTDIFIVSKWIYILLIWKLKIQSEFHTALVWYLIVTNLYTYFIHHVWKDTALKTDEFLISRTKRRFLNLMLAIAFSVFCFGYLMQVPYVADFTWTKDIITFSHALSFSFSNSLAANYAQVNPSSEVGNLICNLELLITFIFVTIIVSRSIPQTNSEK